MDRRGRILERNRWNQIVQPRDERFELQPLPKLYMTLIYKLYLSPTLSVLVSSSPGQQKKQEVVDQGELISEPDWMIIMVRYD